MKRRLPIIALILLSGCSVVSYDRVFPKVTWAWTTEAKEQRRQNREREAGVKAYQNSLKTNAVIVKP